MDCFDQNGNAFGPILPRSDQSVFFSIHMCLYVYICICLCVTYRVVLCRTVSYCVVLCRTVSYRVVLCRTVSYCVVLCRTVSYCVVLCRTVSYCVVLCRTVSYCVVLCRTVSYRVVLCRTVSYCVVLCRTVSYCVVLCRTVSYGVGAVRHLVRHCTTRRTSPTRRAPTPCTTLYDASYAPDASGPDTLYDAPTRRTVHFRQHSPPPPLQTKVIISGKNEFYNWENGVGPFLVQTLLGPTFPSDTAKFDPHAPGGQCQILERNRRYATWTTRCHVCGRRPSYFQTSLSRQRDWGSGAIPICKRLLEANLAGETGISGPFLVERKCLSSVSPARLVF